MRALRLLKLLYVQVVIAAVAYSSAPTGIASFALRMNFSPPANETPRSMRVPVVTVLLKGCLFESAAADYRRRD